MAVTLDQLVASHFAGSTILPSLEVSSETTVQARAGGSGNPLTLEHDPRNIRKVERQLEALAREPRPSNGSVRSPVSVY